LRMRQLNDGVSHRPRPRRLEDGAASPRAGASSVRSRADRSLRGHDQRHRPLSDWSGTTLSADLAPGPPADTGRVTPGVDAKPPRRLRLRYAASCASCGISLSKGTEATWEAAAKRVTCLACASLPVGDPCSPGASAAAEGTRRADRKVADARRKYGDHAAEVAREMADRDAAASWGKGSEGESQLARYIAREVGDGVIALHDRLIPGTRGNIDHIFVAPTGVWVVDSKAYQGKVVQREIGPLWRRDNELYIRGRNRTSLAKGVLRQVQAVNAAVRSDELLQGTSVR
jgi:hypothetical protein